MTFSIKKKKINIFLICYSILLSFYRVLYDNYREIDMMICDMKYTKTYVKKKISPILNRQKKDAE